MFFENRIEAGIKMAEIVSKSSFITKEWDIIGIARGGVVIAGEIAKVLEIRPKAICVEEMVLDKETILTASSTGSGMMFTNKREWFVPNLALSDNLKVRRFVHYAREKQIGFAGQSTIYSNNVLVCDDGVVSGRTLITAIFALRHCGVRNIVAAIPVVTPQIIDQSDFPVITWRITKMKNPATGVFYYSFEDVEDSKVVSMLS